MLLIRVGEIASGESGMILVPVCGLKKQCGQPGSMSASRVAGTRIPVQGVLELVMRPVRRSWSEERRLESRGGYVPDLPGCVATGETEEASLRPADSGGD